MNIQEEKGNDKVLMAYKTALSASDDDLPATSCILDSVARFYMTNKNIYFMILT